MWEREAAASLLRSWDRRASREEGRARRATRLFFGLLALVVISLVTAIVVFAIGVHH